MSLPLAGAVISTFLAPACAPRACVCRVFGVCGVWCVCVCVCVRAGVLAPSGNAVASREPAVSPQHNTAARRGHLISPRPRQARGRARSTIPRSSAQRAAHLDVLAGAGCVDEHARALNDEVDVHLLPRQRGGVAARHHLCVRVLCLCACACVQDDGGKRRRAHRRRRLVASRTQAASPPKQYRPQNTQNRTHTHTHTHTHARKHTRHPPRTLMDLPLTEMCESSTTLTSASNLPSVESYLSRWLACAWCGGRHTSKECERRTVSAWSRDRDTARPQATPGPPLPARPHTQDAPRTCFTPPLSLMATTSSSESVRVSRQRRKLRPIRPKPVVARGRVAVARTRSVACESGCGVARRMARRCRASCAVAGKPPARREHSTLEAAVDGPHRAVHACRRRRLGSAARSFPPSETVGRCAACALPARCASC
jgi:hypothetical protein